MTCSCESFACSSCSTSQVASSIGPDAAVGMEKKEFALTSDDTDGEEEEEEVLAAWTNSGPQTQ